MAQMTLDAFLQALPDEIITVVGNHMSVGDRLSGRLVCKRWKALLRACDTHLQIGPYYLALEPTIAQEAVSRIAGGHILRPRHIVPAAAINGHESGRLARHSRCLSTGDCTLLMHQFVLYLRNQEIVKHNWGVLSQTQAPVDLTHLPKVFPCINKVSVRLIWRHGGVRGEGVSAHPERVTALFDALTAISASRGLPLGNPPLQGALIVPAPPQPPPPPGKGSGAMRSASEGGDAARQDAAGSSHGHGVTAPGLEQGRELGQGGGQSGAAGPSTGQGKAVGQGCGSSSVGQVEKDGLEVTLQLDIDVPRSRYKEAFAAAQKSAQVAAFSLARLGPGIKSCKLQWFDARLAHMSHLGSYISHLTGLRKLELPMTPGSLLPTLSSLTALTSLHIMSVGDEMHMQDLGVPRHTEICVLSHLTNLVELRLDGWVCEVALIKSLMELSKLSTLKLGDDLTSASQDAGWDSPVSFSPASRSHVTGNRGNRHVPQCVLPRLAKLSGPPPMACVHDGTAVTCAVPPPVLPPASSTDVLPQPGSPAAIPQGAARRRSLTPSVILPNLTELVVDLSLFTVSHMVGGELDVGRLSRLTTLRLNVTALSVEDLMILQQVMKVLAAGDLPRLKELHIQMARPQVSPGTVLSTALIAQALRDAAAGGKLPALTNLFVTRQWDGLVPEGWDYTTKGALGGMPTHRLTPSGLQPKQHLSFLKALPSLASLHLQVDRFRLDILPPTLTSLVLEGLVLLEGAGGAAQAVAGSQCPALKKLIVVLAKHPRTHTPPTVPAITPQPAAAQQQQQQAQQPASTVKPVASAALPKLERGQYCVLNALTPVLPTCLTYLSFTATPSPATTRLDQLLPTDYGMHVITQRCPELVSLQLFVMPKYQWLMDCRQLTGLSSLSKLRELTLESPVTGATRLVCLTALSCLTQLTKLSTGLLDDDAYSGHVLLVGLTPPERKTALAWLSRLVSVRFGQLPSLPAAYWAHRRSSTSPAPYVPPGAEDEDEMGLSEAGSEEVEEDGPGALQGSDVEVHSEDLLYESGEGEGEELSSDAMLYEDEDT